ncbi:hypothetical protein AX774_g179 [Zancudomyces culisetae]|uniref:Uncharacterized protein n=1 Tax=Zancudomyces culisetae TaxID=1213189 RepID=A0A1R1PZD0_ZANCU|nr:hypothetical protein AX774_g179 [Zancudomyces culisetae]|eukprot:OMH86287.1 hypothetical protein AX774_g179 [Zancudomyces culisetae]
MSYAELRHYIVHRLLNRKDVAHHLENSREEKSMSDNMVVDLSHEASVLPFKNVGSDLSKSANSYPFRLRAQVIDRDVVRVPSGWDSKAKIQFLREGFKQEECINTWKSDLGRFELYVQKLEEMLSDPSANPKFNLAKLIAKSQKDADEICMHDQSGLLHLYSQVIHPPSYNIPGPNNTTISTHISPELVDYGATAASLYSNLATFEGNQNFLQKLYQDQQSRSESSEDLYSVADSRPRSHKHSISSTTLANKNPSLLPTWNATQSRYNNSESLLSTAIPPLANQPTSISPPPVTNATTSDKTSSVLSSASKKASSSSPKPQSSGFTPTPISTSTSTSTTSGKPSEVLSSFFQNLLDKKTTSQQK